MDMSKKLSIMKEFKDFALKGNIVDMAVGVIIGSAFGKIVSSIVADIIMPVLGIFTKNVEFKDLFMTFDGKTYASIDAAKEAGVSILTYGVFIQNVIDFLIIAFVLFIFMRQIAKARAKKKAKEAATAVAAPITVKTCPYCFSEININAVRCPHCTSELK